MQNFQLIREGLDVAAALNSVLRNPQLWNEHTTRTEGEHTAHKQVSDILLRFNRLDQTPIEILNDCQCLNFPAFAQLPQIRSLVMGLMALVEGEQLGRVIITRLEPDGVIQPHADEGLPANFYQRYHIVLAGHLGSNFRVDDETVCMKTGELWWFDNTKEHEVVNNSNHDRIHLIVDIRTFSC